MKKLIATLLSVLLLTSVLACVGCGERETEKPDAEQLGYTQLDDTIFDEFLQEVDVAKLGDNLVKDSDFASEDGILWSLYTESGGNATLSKQDEQCVVDIKSGGTVSHAVQIFYDCTKMHQFAKYEFSFTASSSIPGKVLEARLQLNGGDYHAYAIKFINLTTEPQNYTIAFTMEDETDPAPRMAFNMGSALDGSEADVDLTDYNVIFDDICLICTDDSQVVEAEETETSKDIIINQLGYAPDDEKIVTFRGFKYVDTFDVVDASGNVVFTGTATEPQVNNAAWEYDWYGDFSEVTTPGTYKITAGVLGESYEFTIGDGLYNDAFDDVVHMLYMQRCGCELPEEHAGEFAHEECHSTKARIYGTDDFIEVNGGWHDAGDYGRYVVPAAKTVVDLLNAYEAIPEVFGDNCNIPESENGIPDVLDEVRYELEWMLKMQDKATGGVYHKVTCAEFPDNVMPEYETEELIVCPMTDYATADFAASMAVAYRTYADIDKAFADKCLAAAVKAWDFLEMIRDPLYTGNPEGIVTGEYPDHALFDEHCWASAELFRVTGDKKYEEVVAKNNRVKMYTGLGWADIGGYAAFSYLAIDKELCDPELRAKYETAVFESADAIVEASKADGYGVSLGTSYPWGSNMTVMNNAMFLLMANDLQANDEYVYYANKHLDYIFGNNPMAISYVTGHGTVSPISTHHRPSQAIETTMPGMLVGGPDSALEDPYAKSVLFNVAPAKCYADNFNSYSCNEITIYWNSPLIYVMSRLCDLPAETTIAE